jgi:hypothetical protein
MLHNSYLSCFPACFDARARSISTERCQKEAQLPGCLMPHPPYSAYPMYGSVTILPDIMDNAEWIMMNHECGKLQGGMCNITLLPAISNAGNRDKCDIPIPAAMTIHLSIHLSCARPSYASLILPPPFDSTAHLDRPLLSPSKQCPNPFKSSPAITSQPPDREAGQPRTTRAQNFILSP